MIGLVYTMYTDPIQKINRLFRVTKLLYEFFHQNRINKSLYLGHPFH